MLLLDLTTSDIQWIYTAVIDQHGLAVAVRILDGMSAVLTDIFRDFLQSLEANARTVSQLGYDYFF
jgi:hypothetical protein